MKIQNIWKELLIVMQLADNIVYTALVVSLKPASHCQELDHVRALF